MKILASILFLLITSTAAFAGQWGVSPTRLDIDAESRSPVLTIINSDKTPLKIQARLMSWTQDNDGKEVLAESKDLVFFPRQMTIQGKDEGSIKIGSLKPIVTASEKTYRIIVEEIPERSKRTEKMSLSFTTKMSIPIYISPSTSVLKAKFGDVTQDPKSMTVPIINTGNAHLAIRHLSVVGKSREGKELCRQDSDKNWYRYLLNKATYSHKIDIPECAGDKPTAYEIEVETDPALQTKLTKTVPVIR